MGENNRGEKIEDEEKMVGTSVMHLPLRNARNIIGSRGE